MTVLVAFVAAVLFGCGTWLLMQRRLTRIIIGIGLLGHGANLLLIAGGGAPGRAPIIGADGTGEFADPLPQALALTAIVITFGVTAFLLGLGYRSWQLTRDDQVEDDVEDRLIARLEAAPARPSRPHRRISRDRLRRCGHRRHRRDRNGPRELARSPPDRDPAPRVRRSRSSPDGGESRSAS
jgi:multicomponent Na+:H+ antiporter subunit C